MRLLLDSHVVLWWLADDPALGSACAAAVQKADEVLVSAVTPWELGIKRSLGKVEHPDGLIDALEAAGFDQLSITARHAEHAAELPLHHRDPFDRMLVAQAQLESLVLVTADDALGAYAVDVLDARA